MTVVDELLFQYQCVQKPTQRTHHAPQALLLVAFTLSTDKVKLETSYAPTVTENPPPSPAKKTLRQVNETQKHSTLPLQESAPMKNAKPH